MTVDTRQHEDGTMEVIVRDAIGTQVDVSMTLNRGILSLVFQVDGEPLGASAELDIDDFQEALGLLDGRE